MVSLELSDVTVSRDGRRLLDGANLSVPDGERVALLGSSGAGKTTLLRTIAGAEPIEHGSILFDGQPVDTVPGRERGVAMVAQYGELLPHRDVAGNIAFPLELRHVPTAEVDRRVRAQARAFAIDDLLTRRSATLSAGETAEVLLARTLVRKPTMVLMDEPFARIDGPTRALLLRDVIRVQEGYAATMLIATNDQRVAASIAPMIAVIQSGRIAQVGSPTELLLHPASLYVAGLSTDGQLNVLPARVMREAGRTSLQVGELKLPTWELAITERAPGPVQIAIHPADLHLGAGDADPHLRGRVVRHTFLGPAVDVTVATEDAQLVVRSPRPAPPVGTRVNVSIRLDRLHVFDAAGHAISHSI